MEAYLGLRHTNSMQFVMVEKLQKSPKSRNCTNHQSRETAQIVCNALTSAHGAPRLSKKKKKKCKKTLIAGNLAAGFWASADCLKPHYPVTFDILHLMSLIQS